MSGDIIASGNLTISGTTSTINTQNLLVKDPIILLASTQSGTPVLDSGIMINRGTGATQAFIWDESNDEFALISTSDSANVYGDLNINSYSNLRLGGLTVSQIKIVDGTQGNGKYLISDSIGLASWSSLDPNIISTTYEDLIISASNSTLLPGNWYNFSYAITGVDPAAITVDYNIFLFSLSVNGLDLTSGKRIMNTPISRHKYDIGTVEDWLYSHVYNIGDKVIFCNRVWNNIWSGGGFIENEYNLDVTTWELEISPEYYEPIVYDISYNLINKEVTHQRDSYNNEIYGEGSRIGDLFFPQNTIDISDWHYIQDAEGNSGRYNNFSKGMWNNVHLYNEEPTIVYNNNVGGFVYRNVCNQIHHNITLSLINLNTSIFNNILSGPNKSIYYNTSTGIENNTLDGSIYFNSNLGDIKDNILDNSIYYNTNIGNIRNNELIGTINKNSNGGHIEYNTATTNGSIYNNSNGSNISNNVVQTTISFNSNVGFISSNISSGSIFSNNGTGNIDSNTIGDGIEYNNTGNISNNTSGLISYNTGGLISLNSNGAILYNTISNKIESNNNTGTIAWNISDTIANNTSNVVDIDENKVGFIETNENVGAITNNVARKIIDNTNDGDIRFNNMTGNIENNDNTGVINYNSGFKIENNGFQVLDIELNEVTDGIVTNTNVGYISQNQAGSIENNSNNCNIYLNDVEQSISNNTNNGDIYKNKAISIGSNNLSGGTIDSNVVKGDIYGNSGAGIMNLNVCAGISSNSKSAISRNTIGGAIEQNNVTSIEGNTGCKEGIIANTLSGSILDNVVGYQIYANTNTGDILRNNVRYIISNNSSGIDDISDNICYAIQNNGGPGA